MGLGMPSGGSQIGMPRGLSEALGAGSLHPGIAMGLNRGRGLKQSSLHRAALERGGHKHAPDSLWRPGARSPTLGPVMGGGMDAMEGLMPAQWQQGGGGHGFGAPGLGDD